MGRKSAYLLGAAAGALALSGPGNASETVTYTYDELGRLVAVATSGGPNDALAVSTTYDPAGNRTNYAVSTGGTPPSPPPPTNNPPVTVNDTGSQQRCSMATYNVLANDSDPEGDYPLSLVSVTGGGFSVLSSTTIQYTSGSPTGNRTGTYTVQDSKGATATGKLIVTVSGGVCQ